MVTFFEKLYKYFSFLIVLTLCRVVFSSEASILNNKGVEEYERGNFEVALSYLTKAYELYPDNEYIRKNLCNVLLALANEKAKEYAYDDAISMVEKVLKIDKDNFFAYLQGGAYCLSAGRVSNAISYLETAIRIKPGYLDAHELLGEAYYRDGDILSAKVQWEYVLQVDPTRKELKEKYDKANREELVQKNFNKVFSGSRHFQLIYPKEISYTTRSTVLTNLEQAYLEIGRKLGGVYPSSSIQVIIYDPRSFNTVVQLGQTIGGVYDGKIRISVLNKDGTELPKEEIKRRIYHEYTHVAVFEYMKDRAPWWVNEGLAEYFSNELTPEKKLLVADANNNSTLLEFSKLEKVKVPNFLKSEEKVSLAYTQSHIAVSMLWRRYGQGKFLNFLREIKEGSSTEDALKQVYSMNYEQLLRSIVEYAGR